MFLCYYLNSKAGVQHDVSEGTRKHCPNVFSLSRKDGIHLRDCFSLHPAGCGESLVTFLCYTWLFMYPAWKPSTLESSALESVSIQCLIPNPTFQRGSLLCKSSQKSDLNSCCNQESEICLWVWVLQHGLQICPLLTFQMASWGEILQEMGV